ncbi:hypothetical protein NXG27_07785 [Megasphaera paucivorans]|uniref:hypothetical protein n=1 Tax=Megasphaera paucivorans TaxID=349095 RepID=UPI0015A3F4EA|nr:hypothetical protein [Megasphaera paucivorans]
MKWDIMKKLTFRDLSDYCITLILKCIQISIARKFLNYSRKLMLTQLVFMQYVVTDMAYAAFVSQRMKWKKFSLQLMN